MDSLQFQKAEFTDPRPKCLACKSVIESSYFHLAGHVICPACAELVRGRQQRPPDALALRGVLFGLGAAAACSAAYAVITMVTGLELALISIAVGYLVGRAIRIGAGGLGARRLQIAAVVLTYLAITISYVPVIVRQLNAPAAKILSALPSVMAIAIVSPLLSLSDGVGGILGILIILFGLMQAWRQTARDARVLAGPYPVDEGQSA